MNGTRTLTTFAVLAALAGPAPARAVDPAAKPEVAAIQLTPAMVLPGSLTGTGQVVLTRASLNDVTVKLTSSNPTAATVPATVTVFRGQTVGRFFIKAGYPQARTPVTVSADLGGGGKTAVLTVQGILEIQMAVLAAAPTTVPAAGATTLTLQLTTPAPPGGLAAQMTYRPAGLVTGPATVTVPAGAAATTFKVAAGSPPTPTQGTVTAVLGQWVKVTAFTVLQSPTSAVLASLTFDPPVLQSAATGTLRVTLTAPAPAGGLVVPLTCSQPSYLTVPPSATVPAGATTVGVPCRAAFLETVRTVQVTATAGGVGRSIGVNVGGTSTVRPKP